MAPVALHLQDDRSSRNANGKNTSTASADAAVAEPRAQSEGTPQGLSSADVIHLEHEYGAHK
jgi:hypothetical protein